MPVYLINGPSSSGKTSVGHELQNRGYRVINTDEEFGYYADLKTEKPVDFPGGDHVSADWYAKNGWIWNKKRVEKAIKNAPDILFFCGGALNESQFYPRFAKIFRLIIDPDTLIKRIGSREGDEHTNNPEFIARMLGFLENAEKDARKLGWVIINTSKNTVRESTDEILSYIT